jgi:hypothetical protein
MLETQSQYASWPCGLTVSLPKRCTHTMYLLSLFAPFAALLPFTLAFPNAPFYTDGRWVKDSSSATFTYIGVNWPGAADTMLPEGLQYQSVRTIVGKIKSSGFNSIRLTFAIEMIDQIFENGGQDVPISTAFTTALGTENGTKIFNQTLANNPSFSQDTTRLQVRSPFFLISVFLYQLLFYSRFLRG